LEGSSEGAEVAWVFPAHMTSAPNFLFNEVIMDEIEINGIEFDASEDEHGVVTPVATFRYSIRMDSVTKRLEDIFLPTIEVTVVYINDDINKSKARAEKEIIKVGRVLARLGNKPGDLHVVIALHPRKSESKE
jgi:hypothetical protein